MSLQGTHLNAVPDSLTERPNRLNLEFGGEKKDRHPTPILLITGETRPQAPTAHLAVIDPFKGLLVT
jgi:hypothetical protein